jgi:hypothetical protein
MRVEVHAAVRASRHAGPVDDSKLIDLARVAESLTTRCGPKPVAL